MAYGDARGAEVRCTLATLDPRAQARYVMAGMAPRWPIYRLDANAAAVARLKADRARPREREVSCDPGAAEKLTAEVFGHGRADGEGPGLGQVGKRRDCRERAFRQPTLYVQGSAIAPSVIVSQIRHWLVIVTAVVLTAAGTLLAHMLQGAAVAVVVIAAALGAVVTVAGTVGLVMSGQEPSPPSGR